MVESGVEIVVGLKDGGDAIVGVIEIRV